MRRQPRLAGAYAVGRPLQRLPPRFDVGPKPRQVPSRAELLRRLARTDDAAAAYRRALELEPPGAERAHVARRLADLAG